jgi:hypothetical protein
MAVPGQGGKKVGETLPQKQAGILLGKQFPMLISLHFLCFSVVVSKFQVLH